MPDARQPQCVQVSEVMLTSTGKTQYSTYTGHNRNIEKKLGGTIGGQSKIVCASFLGWDLVLHWRTTVAKFLVSDSGDKVGSGIGLPYRPARVHRLEGRYDNPMPESTISPIQGL